MKKPAPRKAATAKNPPARASARKRSAPPPAVKPAARRPARGFWEAFNAGMAVAGDPAAVGASLDAALALEGAAAELGAALAGALAAQFARATAAARKRAARPLGAEAIAAAAGVLDILKVYAAAAAAVAARSEEIAAACEALAPAARKKMQSGLTRMALAVVRETNTADVPALMAAVIERALREARGK